MINIINNFPTIYTEKIEKNKIICNKLKELKNLIISKQKNNCDKTKILENVLYPDLICIKELRNKILNILNAKDNKELYFLFLNEINDIFQKDITLKDEPEKMDLKNSFYNKLECLNCFIDKSLIYFAYKSEKNNKAYEYFKTYILSDEITTKSILSSYINIFNLEKLLLVKKIKNNLLDILPYPKNLSKFLNLISILKFQNSYDYKQFLINNKIYIINHNSIIYDLYSTYNSNTEEIFDLTNNLISLNTNFVNPSVIKNILDDNSIKGLINNKIILLLIEKLMINLSIKKEIRKDELNEFISYFSVLSENINYISKFYFIEWQNMNTIFRYYLLNKEFDNCIHFLTSIKNLDIIYKCIGKNYIYNLISCIPINKLGLISNIIKYNQQIINNLLINNSIKDGLKIIKELKLTRDEFFYGGVYDNNFLNNFIFYKICSCNETQFDILVDYGLINEQLYNSLMFKLLKKTYKINPINNNNISLNNNNTISLNEDKEEKINNIFNNLLNNKKTSFFNNIYNKRNNEILTNTDKEKIIILYRLGDSKNYDLSSKNYNLLNNEIDFFSLKCKKINFNKYIPEDKFGPHDISCKQLDEKTNVKFIGDTYSFFNYLKNFKDSKYIGVDSEWRQKYQLDMKETSSILQLANYSEKNVMIIDLLALGDNAFFYDLFENFFKDKIFIGFSFNKNDIKVFNFRLRNFFEKVQIIDLVDIYQHKFLEKAGSLKDTCEKILGIKICKYEKISDLGKRPLKESQLHYAAIDALVCVSLYKKMVENK